MADVASSLFFTSVGLCPASLSNCCASHVDKRSSEWSIGTLECFCSKLMNFCTLRVWLLNLPLIDNGIPTITLETDNSSTNFNICATSLSGSRRVIKVSGEANLPLTSLIETPMRRSPISNPRCLSGWSPGG